jgi:GTP diphosphokinase / guanosine-3',5'-bis(diphosphate) 3'-diphosphatase
MSTLERAIEIAAKAHAGQLDKAGQPYILHPLRVMMTVREVDEKIVAVLHDVVEDTNVTLIDLEKEGFSKTVLAAIFAITKKEGEARLDAAKRVALNHVARAVKLADLADNMDLSRIAHPTEKDFARLEEYKQVMKILSMA